MQSIAAVGTIRVADDKTCRERNADRRRGGRAGLMQGPIAVHGGRF